MNAKQQSKILIADDTPSNIDFMVQALGSRCYEFATATSGQKALRTAAHFRPDLVLLDLMMSDLDGIETCRRLKVDPQNGSTAVIFVTASAECSCIIDGFRAGAVDYVIKPVRPIELRARVETHLKIKTLIESKERLIEELRSAIGNAKQLSGLLPICAACKKIRNDAGYWQQIEQYLKQHSEAQFSHGICPECARHLYSDYAT